MDRDDYFLKEREMVLETVRSIYEAAIRHFTKEENIKDNFIYEFKNNNTKLVIKTNKPGIWIGYKGKRHARFKDILKEHFGHDVAINYEEIKGTFMSTC